SHGSSKNACWQRIVIAASGTRWKRSRTRLRSIAWRLRVIALGWSGSATPSSRNETIDDTDMISLDLTSLSKGRALRVLCLGAHCDDIDIGCGATLLRLLAKGRPTEVTWVVFSARGERARELRASAKRFLRSAV